MAPSVVVGIGAGSRADAGRICRAVAECLRPEWTLIALATLDRKAEVVGAVASGMGAAMVSCSAEQLAAVSVPHPSDRVAGAVSTPSVAEASALFASGGGRLLMPKTVIDGVTVAVAQILAEVDACAQD